MEWDNSILIDGDVAGCVAALKAEDGPEIQVHGSPGLIPVAVGTGKRLFGGGTIPVALKLVDSFVSNTGVTINTYARAGDIDIGEMDFEEPTEAELERRKRLAEAR